MAITRNNPRHPSRGTGQKDKASKPKKNMDNELRIVAHLLKGRTVNFVETPNKGGVIDPKYLVFHYTAGRNAQASIDWLTNPDAKASAHLVVGRDGKITQLAPFNIKTWHAGRSAWDGLSGINTHSIGVEMDNAGPLTFEGTTLKAWFGKDYPKTQAVHAKHKLDQEPQWWHAYTEIQITTATELAKLLVKSYNLKEIVGHEDIAPGRKRDPGPAFPLSHIQALVMGRPEDDSDVYSVTTTRLNIRKGPGTEYDAVAAPLHQGTNVIMLEKRDRWSKVKVDDEDRVEEKDIEGWVYNKYLESQNSLEVPVIS